MPVVRNGALPIQSKAASSGDLTRRSASPSRRVVGPSPVAQHPDGCAPSTDLGGDRAMTARIREFLRTRRDDGPCLVVDLDVVRDNYHALSRRRCPTPGCSTPSRQTLRRKCWRLLAALGSSFDTASRRRDRDGAGGRRDADRISFGNTIKKERDIARAFELGVRLFAVDCKAEVEKIAAPRPAPRCSAASCATARAPNGRCRASSAACPRWPPTCSSMPIAWASRPTACRSMSARSRRNTDAWDQALAYGLRDLP